MSGLSAITPRTPERLRALAGLSALGASTGLGLAELVGDWKVSFFLDNAAPRSLRLAVVSWMAAGVLLALVLGAALWSRWGGEVLSLAARLLAPFALAGVLPPLARREAWPSELTLLLALATTVLLSRPLFRLHVSAYEDPRAIRALQFLGQRRAALGRRFPRWLSQRWGLWLALSAALAYASYMAVFTVLNHLRFGTWTWDISQFDVAFYNTLHGQPFRCPILLRGPAWSDLATHAHFAIWLLTPIYAIHPGVPALLVMQAVIVGAGAIPLYRFAARHVPQTSALVLASAYLLYPALHGAQLFDFHFQPIAASLVLFALDFFDERRMRLFAVFFAASLMCREDVSLGFSAIGLYVLLFTHRTRGGAWILGISGVYFVLMRFVIMPAFGAWILPGFYRDLIPAGEAGFGAVIVTLLTNPLFAFRSLLTPEKLSYALHILTPVAFLPLLRPRLWLSLALGALVTVLTAPTSSIDIGFQYGAAFVPYVFAGLVLELKGAARAPVGLMPNRTSRIERRVSVLSIALGTALATGHFGAIPPRENYHTAYGATVRMAPLTAEEQARLQAFRQAVAQIPKDAIVAAGDHELPHLSNRIEAWNMNMGYDGADYLIYDPKQGLPQEIKRGKEAQAQGWITLAKHERFLLLGKPK